MSNDTGCYTNCVMDFILGKFQTICGENQQSNINIFRHLQDILFICATLFACIWYMFLALFSPCVHPSSVFLLRVYYAWRLFWRYLQCYLSICSLQNIFFIFSVLNIVWYNVSEKWKRPYFPVYRVGKRTLYL